MKIKKGCKVCQGLDPKSCLKCRGVKNLYVTSRGLLEAKDLTEDEAKKVLHTLINNSEAGNG